MMGGPRDPLEAERNYTPFDRYIEQGRRGIALARKHLAESGHTHDTIGPTPDERHDG